MAVTRSSVTDRARVSIPLQTFSRMPELLWLLIASVLVLGGLTLVYLAKTNRENKTNPIDLRRIDRQEQLLPVLDMFPNAADRQFAARKIYEYLVDHGNKLPNVGALGRIHVSEAEVGANRKLDVFRKKQDGAALLSAQQLGQLKPRVAVRDASAFRNEFWLWTGLYFLGFYAVHFFWLTRRFDGEWAILPT